MNRVISAIIASTVVGATVMATVNTADARWGYGYREYGYRDYGNAAALGYGYSGFYVGTPVPPFVVASATHHPVAYYPPVYYPSVYYSGYSPDYSCW
ncbi:MAG: hypothetical protein WCA56_04145 [Xanthobacteraceae bacterium]